MNNTLCLTLTPSQFEAEMPTLHAAGLVPFVMSSPGMGKSALFNQYAKRIGLEHVDTRLAYAAPTDVRGILHVVDGEVRCATPPEYPKKKVVWTLEEFASAPRAVQIAALQLLLERRIGEYYVPGGTFLCATGNRPIDKAHVEKMSSAVINRIVQITLAVDWTDWNAWAIRSGVDPRVLAFLKFRPSLLSDFDGSKWDGHSAFASPRSWEFASKLLAAMGPKPSPHVSTLLSGIIGVAPAVQFTAFPTVFGRIPLFDEIVMDPARANVPEAPDERYAIAAMIMAHITANNFRQCVQYLERMPKDFEVYAINTALKRDKKLVIAPGVAEWVLKNQSFLKE